MALTLPVFWLNGLPSWELCIGLAGGFDLGVGGISDVELLVLYELWAGERFVFGKGSSSLSAARTPNFNVGCSVWSRH